MFNPEVRCIQGQNHRVCFAIKMVFYLVSMLQQYFLCLVKKFEIYLLYSDIIIIKKKNHVDLRELVNQTYSISSEKKPNFHRCLYLTSSLVYLKSLEIGVKKSVVLSLLFNITISRLQIIASSNNKQNITELLGWCNILMKVNLKIIG